MLPLVSVITPIANAERWLAQAIESVLAQTWPRIELLLVDDGSSDRSLEIAHQYEAPNVRILRQTNQGGSAARNLALEHARGDYIQFLDADDVLEPRKIELQLNRLTTAVPDSVGTCAWGRLYDDSLENVAFVPEAVWRDLSPVDWVVTSHLGGGMMATASWLVPRAVAERAGPWAARRMRNEDGEYFNRVVLESSGVLFIPEAKVYYRSNIGGWSTATTEAAVSGLLWSLDSIASKLFEHEDSPRTRGAMATSFDRFVFDFYPTHRVHVRVAEQRVAAFGGSAFVPPTGGVFGLVSRVAGWRVARRLQRLAYRLRVWPWNPSAGAVAKSAPLALFRTPPSPIIGPGAPTATSQPLPVGDD